MTTTLPDPTPDAVTAEPPIDPAILFAALPSYMRKAPDYRTRQWIVQTETANTLRLLGWTVVEYGRGPDWVTWACTTDEYVPYVPARYGEVPVKYDTDDYTHAGSAARSGGEPWAGFRAAASTRASALAGAPTIGDSW